MPIGFGLSPVYGAWRIGAFPLCGAESYIAIPWPEGRETTPELVSLWQVAERDGRERQVRRRVHAAGGVRRILAGRDLGLSPDDSMVHMHYLDGKFEPSPRSRARCSRPTSAPTASASTTAPIREDDECYVTVLRREPGRRVGGDRRRHYTMEDAQARRAHDSSDFWRKYPRRMLFWRALSEAIEAFAPHVVHPVHLPAGDRPDGRPTSTRTRATFRSPRRTRPS
jgi:hypothetical protein